MLTDGKLVSAVYQKLAGQKSSMFSMWSDFMKDYESLSVFHLIIVGFVRCVLCK